VFKDYVLEAVKLGDKVLVDVRGPKEFSGEILAPPEYPTEHAQRGGHIPGAVALDWFKDLEAHPVRDIASRTKLERLLGAEHARERRRALDPLHAQTAVAAGSLHERVGDTTAFVVADADGNMASYITSLSAPFGCTEVVDGTGILLNNRAGRGFSLEPGHPNIIAPGKRTMHTLMAFLATRAGRPYLAWATRGGDGQAQWDFQVWSAIAHHGMNIQAAVERPRWFSYPSSDPATISAPFELRMEAGFPQETYDGLRRLGHHVVAPRVTSGGVQVIQWDPVQRVYGGASDPRADGCAIGI
jgi:gamma-glutamyltranspeptidase/glutathione hydrolase